MLHLPTAWSTSSTLRPATRLPGLQAGWPAVVDGLLTLTNGESCIPEVHNVLLVKFSFRHPVDGIDLGPSDGLSGGVAVLIKHHPVNVCEHRLKEPHEVEGGVVRDSDGRSRMQGAGMANSQREMPFECGTSLFAIPSCGTLVGGNGALH